MQEQPPEGRADPRKDEEPGIEEQEAHAETSTDEPMSEAPEAEAEAQEAEAPSSEAEEEAGSMAEEPAGEAAEEAAEEVAEPAAAAPAAKADITKRIIAGVIDAVAAVIVGMIPWIGGLVATAYWLVRDGLEIEFMDQRSLGKKVMKLRPVTLDGSPMDLATSAKRNWPFAIGGIAQLLLFVPILGWILLVPIALIALIVGVIEIVLAITDAKGRRMGDKFANTIVIEVDA